MHDKRKTSKKGIEHNQLSGRDLIKSVSTKGVIKEDVGMMLTFGWVTSMNVSINRQTRLGLDTEVLDGLNSHKNI